MIEMRMRYAGMKITSLFKEPGLCFYCIVCGWEKAVPAACGDPHKKPAVQSVAAGSCFGCNESGKTGVNIGERFHGAGCGRVGRRRSRLLNSYPCARAASIILQSASALSLETECNKITAPG